MNTIQITHALAQDPITSKKLCGVFLSDKLPRTIDKYPCAFVANTAQAANQDCTGLASIFQPNGKEAFFTHTGSRQNFMGLRL